ncbi:MAG: hypothetical protein IBJ11_09495 [Phycisphaerales bacterium]|nr:hypothetical protein [Phycisphaerales bacterium]
MTLGAGDILRRLGGVVPGVSGTAGAGAGGGAGAIESASFADLLGRVRSGEMSSGRTVEVDPRSGVELSKEQLRRLSAATDAAEAAGASRLLAVIDGKIVGVDVAARVVTKGPSQLAGRVVGDFDAMVVVPEGGPGELKRLFAAGDPAREGRRTDGAGEGARIGLGGGTGSVRNASVAELLASLSGVGGNGEKPAERAA